MGNQFGKVMQKHKSKSERSKKHRCYLTLSGDDIRKLTDETHFTDSEIVAWHGDFLKDCPNGLLSEKQFISMYKQIANNENASTVARYLFRAFDIDGTHNVDFSEFMHAISITTRGSYEEKLSMIFRLYDINHDGKLEKKEVVHIIKTLFDDRISEERISEVFHLLDLNSDSIITKNEFIKACSNNDEVRKLLDPENHDVMEATF